MERTERIRCFFCIPLPSAIAREISAWIELGRRTPRLRGVRWLRCDNLHITLRFCGEIPPASVQRLKDGARQIIAESFTSPLELSIGPLGSFGRPPRVLWAGLLGDVGQMGDLHRRLDKLCNDEGLRSDHAHFAPHITLARIPSPIQLGRLAPWPLTGCQWTIQGIEFTRSRLTPAGPRYSTIESYPFQPQC